MKINPDRQWWNNLDNIWKEELISVLFDSPEYTGKDGLKKEVLKSMKVPDKLIADIVNLEKVHISRKVLFDLTPLFYLKNINDFHIEAPEYDTADFLFLKMYPKHLRSKVQKLILDYIDMDDLSPLEDFVNLEVLQCQGCQLVSLDGIEKMTKLKDLTADQGNYYFNLELLQGLGLIRLNLEYSNVTDISPLQSVPALEFLDLRGLKIDDLSPLLHLPNLKEVCLPDGMEISSDKLEQFLFELQIKLDSDLYNL